ncbi:putative alkaline phytoceramidase [Metarhizium anisopliae]|nr:putative alkaline phytoceramidase [Metarhizium anisopliae]
MLRLHRHQIRLNPSLHNSAMNVQRAKPFWGAPTSNLNFCEEDYLVTRYIAEFINTLSSLVYVAYGIYGLAHGRRNGSRLVSYCGLIGVGVCSAGYHMTLKYHTQMSDELSMHLLSTPLLHRVLTFNKSERYTKTAGVVLFVLFTVVMAAHMLMDEFLLHATTFGFAVYMIATRVMKLIPQQVPDPQTRSNIKKIARFGTISFGFGFFVWLIDEWACGMLNGARQSVGLPAAFFLELHGWWHTFTAIGGYIAVALVDEITTGQVTADPIPLLAWPVPLAAKYVLGFTKPEKANGVYGKTA